MKRPGVGEGMATVVERRGDSEHRVRREERMWGDQWEEFGKGSRRGKQ